MAFSSSSLILSQSLPRRLSTASASAERFRTLARNNSQSSVAPHSTTTDQSSATAASSSLFPDSSSFSRLFASSSFDEFSGQDLGTFFEADPSLFVFSDSDLSALATAAPQVSAADPLALDTTPDFDDVWLNTTFSSGLSISGEPAPKAPRVRTRTSLGSSTSVNGITSTGSFGRLLSSLFQPSQSLQASPQQPQTPSTASVAGTSTNNTSSQLSFILGSEVSASAAFDEKPTEMLQHDPLFLERLCTDFAPKVPRQSPATKASLSTGVAGKASLKTSAPRATKATKVSKASEDPIFKFRETAEQRKKRYADTEQVNTMLKQSIRDAQDTVNNTVDLLLLLEQDGKLRLNAPAPAPASAATFQGGSGVALPPPLHFY